MRCFIALVMMFLLLLGAIQSGAQESASNSVGADSYFRYMPSSDREQAPGEVGLVESGAELSYSFRVADKLPVTISVGEEFVDINEKDVAVGLPSHLTAIKTDFETYLPTPYEKWYIGVGVRPSFYSDNWDGDSDSFRISTRSFLVYRPSEELTMFLGVALFPGYKDNIWPVAGLIYKPDGSKWAFNLTPKRPGISYKLNERLTALLEGGFTSDEYQVKRDSATSAVLRYKGMRIGSGLEYAVNNNIKACVSVGGALNRSLEYKDHNGKVNIKNGLYTQVRLQAKF